MSVFTLKIIAMVAMVCDHLGHWLLSEGIIGTDVCTLMRAIGRLAFPIFAFLIANGYRHSRSRLRYLTRLLAFAVISQIPFTIVFSGENYAASPGALHFELMHPAYLLLALLLGLLWYRFIQAGPSALLPTLALVLGLSTLRWGGIYLLRPDMNVFYTLALGLAVICVLDEGSKERDRAFYARAATLLIALLLVWDRADYGLNGVLLILLFWYFYDNRLQQLLLMFLWALLQYSPFSGMTVYFICACLAALPLWLYKGRPGPPLKAAFYLVYPLHLLLIALAVIV